MNYKKYLFIFVAVLIVLNFSNANAAFTPSGRVSCLGVASPNCFLSTKDSRGYDVSYADAWTMCPAGYLLQGYGVSGDGGNIHKNGANCYDPISKNYASALSCHNHDGVRCSIESMEGTEDWAYCPAGWLLKAVGFRFSNGDITQSIGKCYDPVNKITISNNYACNDNDRFGFCTHRWDVSQVESYVECLDADTALSAVGFTGDNDDTIIGISHICSKVPRPASPTPTRTPIASIAPGVDGIVNGFTFEKGTISGVPTTVRLVIFGNVIDKPTNASNNYYYSHTEAAGANVSVSIPSVPSGYSLVEYKYCYTLASAQSGCMETENPGYNIGSSVTLPIRGNQSLDVFWRFTPNGGPIATPSPLPTQPPKPIVNIVGPISLASGPIDANNRMEVTLDWSFSDAPNFAYGTAGTQSFYRIQIQDQDRLESASASAGSCSGNTSYRSYCMDGVDDFKTMGTGGGDDFNNEYQPGPLTSRVVHLEQNRNYRWHIRAKSSNGSRLSNWSSNGFFTTGTSTVTPSPLPPASIDLRVDGADYSQANPLDKEVGDVIHLNWVGAGLVECVARKTSPEDSDPGWWNRDNDFDGEYLLPSIIGSYNLALPGIPTSGPLYRLLKYMIVCSDNGTSFDYDDSVFVRVVNPPVAKFRAEPALVKPNQMSQLIWSCENSTYAEIDNAVMSNPACEPSCSGVENVYPAVTTTYTLTCKNGKAGFDVVRIKSATVQVGSVCEGNIPCENPI